MQTLSLNPEQMKWLIGAIEGKPAGDTAGAIIKGNFLIDVAGLLEAENQPPKLEGVIVDDLDDRG